MKPKIYSLLKWLLIAKFALVFLRAFAPFSLPHEIRQTDTMGVAIRYWMRWTIEADYSLLPAVLSSGNARGIQSMELPFYNILLSPAFFMGTDVGRPLAQILSLLLMAGLTFVAFNFWRGKTIAGIKVDLAFGMLFITAISSKFWYRFMPDYFAFILAMIAMGFIISRTKSYRLPSFILLTLGLLVKPPVVVTLAPLLILLDRQKLFKVIASVILPACAICVLYYTSGIHYLRSVADQPEYFYTSLRNPLTSLIDFFSQPKNILDLFIKNIFGHLLLIPLILNLILKLLEKERIKLNPLFVLLILQILAIAALDGSHAFIHDYYFVGTSFVASLILVQFLESGKKPAIALFVGILIFGMLEKMSYEIRPLWTKNSWKACSELKKRNPDFPWGQGYPFRSIEGPIPYLGVCFGERQASTSNNFGFYSKADAVPQDCRVADEESGIILVKCYSNGG